MSRAAAFFDVDGTLVDRHIVHQYVYIRQQMLSPFLRRLWTGAFYAKAPYYLILDKVSRTRLNKVFYRNYKGLSSESVRERVDDCFKHVIEPNIFCEGEACVAEHKAAGRHIVLATGSIDFIIAPLAEKLGADHVCAPTLIENNGRFTGRLNGPPVGEEEKARRITEYAERQTIDLAASFGYGDSIADLPMLERVGHPHVVNPDAALLETATSRNWPVLKWTVNGGAGNGR